MRTGIVESASILNFVPRLDIVEDVRRYVQRIEQALPDPGAGLGPIRHVAPTDEGPVIRDEQASKRELDRWKSTTMAADFPGPSTGSLNGARRGMGRRGRPVLRLTVRQGPRDGGIDAERHR